MIKEAVCIDCSYRFGYNTDQDSTTCPICGRLYEIIHLPLIEEMFKEGDDDGQI